MEIDGAELRRLRENAGMDIKTLAAKAQVAQSYISMLESGYRESCSPLVAARLAGVLKVAIKDLRP